MVIMLNANIKLCTEFRRRRASLILPERPGVAAGAFRMVAKCYHIAYVC